jgi:hypothetical protein
MGSTYQELKLDDKRQMELTIYTTNGDAFLPSGASYIVRNLRHSIVIPKTSASVDANKIHTQIPLTVTSSAGEYEVLWEIRKGNERFHHCTRLLVDDA